MASTNLVKANDKLEAALTSTRKRLKESEDEFVRKGAGLASGFVIGALEKNGKLAQMPTIPGVPRIVTLGIVLNAAAMFAPKGKMRQALDGAGESALNVASYKWGKGEDVAGVGEVDVGGPRARARRTDSELRDVRAQVRALEQQLAQQVQESQGYEAPAYYQGYQQSFPG